MRRIEEAIDQCPVGLVGGVVQKGLDLPGGRGQARQPQGSPPNQGAPIRIRGKAELVVVLPAPRQDQGIDRSPDPPGLVHSNRDEIRPADGLEGPEGAFLGTDVNFAGGQGFRFGPRRNCSLRDPPRNPVHHLGRHFLPLRRHLPVPQFLHQEAFFRAPSHDGGPLLAPGRHQSAQAQVQFALQFLARPVAIETEFLQDRANVVFEGESALRIGKAGASQDTAHDCSSNLGHLYSGDGDQANSDVTREVPPSYPNNSVSGRPLSTIGTGRPSRSGSIRSGSIPRAQ